MSIQDFYAVIGGDYDTVKGRLASDERIEKFVNMFFMDESYDNLLAALDAGDMATAFRCAHTMKGNARNVELGKLADSSSELAEALRPNEDGEPTAPEKVGELLEAVKQDMGDVTAAREAISR